MGGVDFTVQVPLALVWALSVGELHTELRPLGLALRPILVVNHHMIFQFHVFRLLNFLLFVFDLLRWFRRRDILFPVLHGPFDLDYPRPMDYDPGKKEAEEARTSEMSRRGDFIEKDVNDEEYPPLFELDVIRHICFRLPVEV